MDPLGAPYSAGSSGKRQQNFLHANTMQFPKRYLLVECVENLFWVQEEYISMLAEINSPKHIVGKVNETSSNGVSLPETQLGLYNLFTRTVHGQYILV